MKTFRRKHARKSTRRLPRRQHGGDVNDNLWDALVRRNVEMVKHLIIVGRADVNYKYRDKTLLIELCMMLVNSRSEYRHLVHYNILKLLLENGANPNIPYGNITPLLYLSMYITAENETIVYKALKLLLEYGADPNAQTTMNGATVLHLVLHSGITDNMISVVTLLLEYGADKTITDRRGADAEKHANRISNAIIRERVLHVLKTTEPTKVKYTETANQNPTEALHRLLLSQTPEDVMIEKTKEFLEKGADLESNSKDDKEMTPLLVALSNKKEKVANFLLDVGANPNAKSKMGSSALLFAAEAGLLDVLKRLQILGNDIHYQNNNGKTALMYVCAGGYFSMVKYLVDQGADINHIDIFGGSALSYCVNRFNKEIVQYLLNRGADPNKANMLLKFSKKTVTQPIVAGLFPDHIDVLPLFLEKGQDPNVMIDLENGKASLLSLSISYNKPEALKQVLDAGGDPNQVINDISLIHFAVGSLKQQCVKVLLEKGADVNSQQNATRMTTLIRVIQSYNQTPTNIHIEIMKDLLAAGVKLDLKDSHGKVAADYAEDEEVEKLLGILKVWEGWSRADVAFLNNIFTEETRPIPNTHTNTIPRATDFSLCPVCLKTVERPQGCMHMKHDCATQGGFYHKALYAKYKVDGGIHWCTICNRIGWAQGTQFLHYNLGLAQGPIPGKAQNSYLFDKDCSTRSGGGGLPEKYHRFNRMRSIALDYNDPTLVGNLSHREVLESLVEAMWDAPFVKDPLSKLHWERKQWRRPNTNFPLPKSLSTNMNVNNNNNTNPNTNVAVPAGVQDPIVHPVETEEFANATFVDDKDIIQFQHPDSSGVLRLHNKPGQQISRIAFSSWLSDLLGKPPTDEQFGHCWMFSEVDYGSNRCTAKLYPMEVRLALGLTEEPTEGEHAQYRQLYKNYRMLFNRKERGTL